MQLFTATWNDFQQSFKLTLDGLLHHRELIERTANLEQIQESRDARAALEKELRRMKIVAVVNWLSAADARDDQDAFNSMRNDIPGTGRWILGEPKIKEWLDPSQSSVPLIWLYGKPGAGQLNLLMKR